MEHRKLISSRPPLGQTIAVVFICLALGVFIYVKGAGVRTSIYFGGACIIFIYWSVRHYWKVLTEVHEYRDYLQIRRSGKVERVDFLRIAECRLQSGIVTLVLLAPGKFGRVIQFIPGNEFQSSEVSRRTVLSVQQRRARENLSRQEGKLISSSPRSQHYKALACAVIIMPISAFMMFTMGDESFMVGGTLAILAAAWYLVFAWGFANSVHEFGDFLLVARRGKKEKVYFSDITKIRISHQSLKEAIIFIHLRTPGIFGSKIRFCPGDGYALSEVSRRCMS